MSHSTIALALHGGAGTILRETMTPELQAQYQLGLQTALDAGYAILEAGGSAIDAVAATVSSLEDCPLFNAGRGSVFNHIGEHEMDAAIMAGNNLACGAVAGIQGVRNPVQLARAVMEETEHVLLIGQGAQTFAQTQDFPLQPASYFFTQQRFDQWQQALQEGRVQLDHTEKKFGTVGAVALDIRGDLAAATSTGGMTNKQFGRVGDSPIIGAGTWAANDTCAISCTGHGELFIKAAVAHDIHCLMSYKGLSLQEASDLVVLEKLVKIGGEGGLVAVDAQGNISMPFNSDGMYRACKSSGREAQVLIYK
ncbi:MAG: isoaspartyl peptidase/L-asparaginase [Bacteroidetes bacterium]|nr:isoaspartyl peptidase/L-asparaginase [Bacteroidota bacterium]